MLRSLKSFWILILELSLSKTFLHRWNLEVTVCNSWHSGSLVLAMLHLPHIFPNMCPTQLEWHTNMISCHICRLISPFFPSWHTTISQERYTLHVNFTKLLFVFLHTTLCTCITFMFMKFQVWVHDSKGNTTEQICDNSGEDPKCCRFDGSYLPGTSNVVSL